MKHKQFISIFRFTNKPTCKFSLKSIIYATCKFLIYCNKEETVSENITQCMAFPRVENIT